MRSENPVVLRVFPAPNGRWYVVEVAFRKPLTDFVTRHAAEKYAASVAKIKARATVELYGRGGRLEARTSYPPIEAPEPASVELAAKDGNRWLSLEPTQNLFALGRRRVGYAVLPSCLKIHRNLRDCPAASMALTSWFLIIGTLLVFMALASSLLKRLPLSTATLYLFVGFALGPAGVGLLLLDPVEQSAVLKVITEIAVIISLFSAGLKLRLPLTDHRWWLPVRLGALTMLVTIALIALLGVFALGLPTGAALVLAAALAPTDAVLASDVQVKNVSDRDRVRFSLTGEAGLNDGFALPLFLLGLGLLGLYELGPYGGRWFVLDFSWGIGAGIASGWLLGSLIGHLVVYLRRVHHEAVGLEEFIALGLIALSYGVALLCHSDAFLAVFTAGVALRRIEHRASGEKRPEQVVGTIQIGRELEIAIDPQKAPAYMTYAVLNFNEQLERIAEVTVVLLIGGMLSVGYISPEAIVVAPVLFLVIRPVAVMLGLAGSRTPAVQRNLMAWFGIRGIGSIYYILAAVEYGLPKELVHRLMALILTLVAISIIIYGISATPLMELYRRWRP